MPPRGAAALAGAEGSAVGLYVHIPFCESKCTSCHFAIDPRLPGEDRQERYVRAVLAEMRSAEMQSAERSSADTLYFGGGTPSLVTPARLARMAQAARELFHLSPAAEITLEANPRDLDAAGYEALLDLGVNRLSLGVQSLDDGVLGEMGRHHSAADAQRAVTDARRAGFENLNLDLILGWPGETRERAAEALFTGLRRREGIDLAAYRRCHDLDPLTEWRSGLDAAQAAGLAVIDGARLRLTDRGMLLSNEVFQAFV